jgi:hypothetical protein
MHPPRPAAKRSEADGPEPKRKKLVTKARRHEILAILRVREIGIFKDRVGTQSSSQLGLQVQRHAALRVLIRQVLA